MAAASDYVPGSGSAELFQKDIVDPVVGKERPEVKLGLRRLFFEAFSLMAASNRAHLPGLFFSLDTRELVKGQND